MFSSLHVFKVLISSVEQKSTYESPCSESVVVVYHYASTRSLGDG